MADPVLTYTEWCDKIVETLSDFGVEDERITKLMDFRNDVPLADIYMNGNSYMSGMYCLLRHEESTPARRPATDDT